MEHITQKPRLLIVDDEEAILLSMSDYFAAKGFEVATASSLGAAQILLEQPYDAAIVDLRLDPGGGEDQGLVIVQHIRERWPQAHVLVLTAYGNRSLEQRAQRLGVDSFLHKPKPLPDIAQIIFGLLSEGEEV